MQAHHPITGAPIKILKTETHLWKNQKTVVWLRHPPGEFAHRYRRWNTVVFRPDLAERWRESLGNYPSAIVLKEATTQNLAWLESKAPRERNLLFLSRALMDVYTQERFQKEKFINVICLDELGEIYPHTLHKYKSTESDCSTLLSIALVYRAARVYGIEASELSEDKDAVSYLSELKTTYDIEVGALRVPEPLWLVQQYYNPGKPKRFRELKKCLDENIKNPCIDTIVLLNEEDMSTSLPTSSKIKQVLLGHRMTYADVFRYIKEEVPSGTIVAFANADIYLDESWNTLWSMKMKDTFLSLLRYEEPTSPDGIPELFGPRPDSQDTWVVHSDSVKSREWDYSTLEFEFGKAGCDNAINVEMLKKRFVVANPALTFHTLHCHSSQYRTYDPNKVVEKPMFLYLDPTGLHDLEPKSDIQSFERSWHLPKPFSRRIHAADSQTVKTLCAMVNREESRQFEPDADNLFEQTIQEERLYSFQNAFTTTTGLCYGYNSIFLGRQSRLRELWANQVVSQVTPCIGVKSTLGVELSDETAKNPFSYLVYYLSRIFQVQEEGYEGDFWLPRTTKRLQEFLQYFSWKEKVLPLLPRDDSIAAYSQTTTMMTPRSKQIVYKEDIEALRKRLKTYQSKASGSRVVLVQDDTFFDSDVIEAMERALEAKGYDVDVVYIQRSSPSFLFQRILGAKTLIVPSGCEELYWMLPGDARVLEVMPELSIKGAGAHMAGACGLEYWITLIQRAKKEQQRDILVKKVLATLEASEKSSEVLPTESSLPIVTLPTGFTGYHGHAGDSFREMAALWSEQGKCRLEYSATSPYVWWGRPGDVLLYDRANYNWLRETPASFKKVLVGNPAAEDYAGATQWSFWPRHPRRVELRVARGLPVYGERTKTLVFYGKVENGVQKEHRSNDLWRTCDEFDMPIGETKSYKYSPEEYLNQLAQSKFGLCLAGYGPKCNREIECMALGTVPVVAPDVDMTHYINPPQENVHYIRAHSFDPTEIQARLSQVSEATWTQMSTAAHEWWKQNSSAEGLWTLTKALVEDSPGTLEQTNQS